MTEKIYSVFESMGVRTAINMPLKGHSSFRVGGVCRLAIFPSDLNTFVDTLSVLKKENVPFRVIGRGSNILFGDGVVEEALVFTEGVNDITVNGTDIMATAGVTLSSLASAAADAGLTGLEFAKGIPGSVGGAMFMNAGAYGGEMSDIVVSSVAFDLESGKTVDVTDHFFGYRKSLYSENRDLICISCRMTLRHGEKEKIFEKMKAFAESRREKQPLNYPSAGSYFKRPCDNFAGKLIEDAGLKGYRVGDACVSEKHAGFVVNLGNATAEDVLALEKHVRDTVYKKFGILLEREVQLID